MTRFQAVPPRIARDLVRGSRVVGLPGVCWVWTGKRKSRNGYGRIRINGHEIVVHRLLYQVFVASVSVRTVLDHKCRNRACCNPGHLEPMCGKRNTLIGVGPTAVNAGKIVCLRGHPLKGRNVYKYNGKRECRTCKAVRRKRS